MKLIYAVAIPLGMHVKEEKVPLMLSRIWGVVKKEKGCSDLYSMNRML